MDNSDHGHPSEVEVIARRIVVFIKNNHPFKLPEERLPRICERSMNRRVQVSSSFSHASLKVRNFFKMGARSLTLLRYSTIGSGGQCAARGTHHSLSQDVLFRVEALNKERGKWCPFLAPWPHVSLNIGRAENGKRSRMQKKLL